MKEVEDKILSSGFFIFFFFKQKTAYEIYQCDWSSDVCSSDLAGPAVTSAPGAIRGIIKPDPGADSGQT